MLHARHTAARALILRSGRSPRLEGWTQRADSWPSFETRARRAPQDEVGNIFAAVGWAKPPGRAKARPMTGSACPPFKIAIASVVGTAHLPTLQFAHTLSR